MESPLVRGHLFYIHFYRFKVEKPEYYARKSYQTKKNVYYKNKKINKNTKILVIEYSLFHTILSD
jgi:hypothetical protein